MLQFREMVPGEQKGRVGEMEFARMFSILPVLFPTNEGVISKRGDGFSDWISGKLPLSAQMEARVGSDRGQQSR